MRKLVDIARAAWGIPRYALPGWARRNMRSKYTPHTGEKQAAKCAERDYMATYHCKAYEPMRGERCYPIICTLASNERGERRILL